MHQNRFQGLALPALLAVLALAGCTPRVGGDKVRLVTDRGMVRDCQYLTQVDGGFIGTGLVHGMAPRSAMDNLRSRAFAAGGNAVFLVYHTRTYETMNLTGDVYHCDNDMVHRPGKPVLPGPATPIDPKRLLEPVPEMPDEGPGKQTDGPVLPGPATPIDPARLGNRGKDKPPAPP